MADAGVSSLVEELDQALKELEKVTWGARIDAITKVSMTHQQVRLLGLLSLAGPKRPTELAANLGVSLPTISGLVDRLENQGMVERTENPDDRRVKVVQASTKGVAALRAMLTADLPVPHQFIRSLPPEQLKAIIQAIKVIAEVARAHPMSSALD